MTKEEAIKKAYGEYWQRLPKRGKEQSIESDGYVHENYLIPSGVLESDIPFEECPGDCDFHRPKSLAGIENNNGWVKIESEDDLPQQMGNYWAIHVEYGLEQRFFYDKTEHNWDKITHYQPIKKPRPPIF